MITATQQEQMDEAARRKRERDEASGKLGRYATLAELSAQKDAAPAPPKDSDPPHVLQPPPQARPSAGGSEGGDSSVLMDQMLAAATTDDLKQQLAAMQRRVDDLADMVRDTSEQDQSKAGTGGFLIDECIAGMDQLAFWHSGLSGNTVTIGQGHLVFHRKGAWLAAQKTVTLDGSGYTYVVATASKNDPSDFAIETTSIATIPSSASNLYVFPLHLFYSADGGTTYSWVVNLLAGTALQLGSPL